MLRKIQKKPLAFRKKLLIGGLIAATVIILPIWLLNLQNTLQNRQTKNTDQPKSQKIQDLEEVKDELTATLREFRKTLEIIRNQTDAETKDKINDSQILTLPE
ncbi:MAG: hypothetical protein ABH896_01430 [Candidatus Jacksonbacteria bacterium]